MHVPARARLHLHRACSVVAVLLFPALGIAQPAPHTAGAADPRPRVGIIADQQDDDLRAIEELIVARLSATDPGVDLELSRPVDLV